MKFQINIDNLQPLGQQAELFKEPTQTTSPSTPPPNQQIISKYSPKKTQDNLLPEEDPIGLRVHPAVPAAINGNYHFLSYHAMCLASEKDAKACLYHMYHMVSLILSIAMSIYEREPDAAQFDVAPMLQDEFFSLLIAAGADTRNLSEVAEPPIEVSDNGEEAITLSYFGNIRRETTRHTELNKAEKILFSNRLQHYARSAKDAGELERHKYNFLFGLDHFINDYEEELSNNAMIAQDVNRLDNLQVPSVSATLTFVGFKDAVNLTRLLQPCLQLSNFAPYIGVSPPTVALLPSSSKPTDHIFHVSGGPPTPERDLRRWRGISKTAPSRHRLTVPTQRPH